MLDELVGDAHAVYVGMVSVVGHELQYGTSEASLDGAVLEGDDALVLAAYLVEDVLVDWLEEAHIVVGYADTLNCYALDSLGCEVPHGTDAEEGDIVILSPACTSFDAFPNFEVRGNTFKKHVLDYQ